MKGFEVGFTCPIDCQIERLELVSKIVRDGDHFAITRRDKFLHFICRVPLKTPDINNYS